MPRFIPNTGLGATVLEHLVQRLEHEAVAAERDQRFGLLGRRESVAAAEHRFGRLGDVGARRQEADPGAARSMAIARRAWARQRSTGDSSGSLVRFGR